MKNIHKNSITYFDAFDAKDLDLNHDFYKLMETLYSNTDFYSVLSTFEMIRKNDSDKVIDYKEMDTRDGHVESGKFPVL